MNWHDPWPRISRNPEDILRLKPPVYGLDWEWNVRDERPTIMGVADAETAVGTTHEQGLPYLQALAANQPNVTYRTQFRSSGLESGAGYRRPDSARAGRGHYYSA